MNAEVKPISVLRGRISAEIICDSIANGTRLTTMVLNYPRFIHAEFMTHRMFSRNASSSRAIPVEKMIRQVEMDYAYPAHWGKNQPGMQAREELDPRTRNEALGIWHRAAGKAVDTARELNELGVHKQVTNRILEPFQFIKVVVTATEWDNFFALRKHPDAQPEIHELAVAMSNAMELSTPCSLGPAEWHLPFVDSSVAPLDDAIKASVARCARVSYLNHDKSDPDLNKDIALHDTLLQAQHMSPFEHIAYPAIVAPGNDRWFGNFRNWVQYRQTL